MLHGRVKAAVRWATERARGSVLNPNDVVNDGNTVFDILKSKHPPPSAPTKEALIDVSVLPEFEEVELTNSHVLCSARKIQGAAGPGGCDAGHWHDVLLRYGAHSDRLREAVSALARRLTNTIVPWNDIRALVSNRLIALDKCPGVRPVAIGETLRRIIGKMVCTATRLDLEVQCGTDQLCAGIKCGIEGAVHAMCGLFNEHQSHSGWGVLLVDATNAFNSLNRAVLLWNARVMWPRCSRFLFNTYQGWATLVLWGTVNFLFSREGVTQGDPLSMFLYAVGTLPLIHRLKNPTQWTQMWYADDASACGELSHLLDWFKLLQHHGPSYGYYPNPSKCCLVVDHKSVSAATAVFGHLDIEIVTSHRFLGGFLGDSDSSAEFVTSKVQKWVSSVRHLSEIAVSQPQAAYAAMTKSLQCEWTYLQRVIPSCDTLFAPLEHTILTRFLPALFGCEVSQLEQQVFSLPVRWGGLGLTRPCVSASLHFSASQCSTQVIVKAIRNMIPFELDSHELMLFEAQKEYKRLLHMKHNDLFDCMCSQLDPIHHRALLRAKDNDLSVWLSVLPTEKDNFDLTPQEFRDALAIRYRKPLLNVPAFCDGCGAPSTLDHFLTCLKGGLIVQRHNEIRDAVGDLAAMVWGQVRREPIISDAAVDPSGETLVADLSVRGVWLPQAEALFDVRIVDTDAQSYLSHTPKSVLFGAEIEKKRKYSAACCERRAHFTPLCFSVDGLTGGEASSFIRRLASGLAVRWDKNYSNVLGWVRARLGFALVRATVLCLRGSRTRWRSLGFEDGAAID